MEFSTSGAGAPPSATKDQSMHPARIGSRRADELANLFRTRLNALCVAAVKESKTVLTIEQAEQAAFNAAEELADTLRGRLRQRARDQKQKERATYEQ
jgi:replicative superfamily II helicase